MTAINTASFIVEKSSLISVGSTREDGTVEVTLRGITKRVRASRWVGGQIMAYDLVGRYATGAKAWPATLRYNPGSSSVPAWESASFGRDDRSVKFNKVNAVYFKP